jgi:gliding motility-associated-like protein
VITFTGAGGVAPYTFEYSIDNGPIQTVTTTGGNSATILASTANAGTFSYDLISVTDGSATGCGQAQSGTVTVIVNPLPTATISGDAEVCLNAPAQTITFTGAGGVAPYTFTYTVNGGANQTITSTGTTATISVPTTTVGVTTYSLVGVQDASTTGCYQAQTGLASVEIVSAPPIYAGVDFTVCEGDDIVLTASGGVGYVWNGGAIQDGVPFPATQTDTFVVIGTNPTGCIATDTVVVTVSPIPQPSFVADTTMGCAPLEVTFTNTTPGGPLTDCIWTLSNGAILNGCGSVSYVFEQGGTYDVTLETTTLDGCTAQATYQYYIYVEQPAIADFSASSTVVSTMDSEVQFINESQNADGYIWSFGDGSSITTEENPTHVFPNEEFGMYGVTLIATTPLGCNDTMYVVIKVEEEIIFYVPNTFTPDDDDFNPTFKPVFTSGYDPFDYTLLIFNRWGEIIFESHNVDIGWDGTYGVDGQRREVQDGTYTWTIDFKTVNSDERMYVNGHVNVLR